MVLRMMKMM